MASRIAVAGVTGNTGSVVAAHLLDSGHPVRVIVRDKSKGTPWASRGAEVAVADIDDAAALERALDGAGSVYLLSPPLPGATDMLADAHRRFLGFARAVKGAGVAHVVLLSSIGAQQPDRTGPVLSLRDGEEVLAETGAALTAIRAAYFMDNWGLVLGMAREEGVLPSFIPASQEIPMVATADICAVAAIALIEGPRGRRIIELSGPVEVSPNDVARMKNPEWHEFTARARQQGKIRAVGMSGHAGRLIECLDYALDADSVDVILVAYNFGQDPTFYQPFTRSFDFIARQPQLPRVLQKAKSKNVGVIAMKTLMGARLIDMRPFEKGGATFAQAAW